MVNLADLSFRSGVQTQLSLLIAPKPPDWLAIQVPCLAGRSATLGFWAWRAVWILKDTRSSMYFDPDGRCGPGLADAARLGDGAERVDEIVGLLDLKGASVGAAAPIKLLDDGQVAGGVGGMVFEECNALLLLAAELDQLGG